MRLNKKNMEITLFRNLFFQNVLPLGSLIALSTIISSKIGITIQKKKVRIHILTEKSLKFLPSLNSGRLAGF